MATYDPESTRESLVQATFDEVYQNGVRAASLEGILGRVGVTKGALYHHFDNKKALCAAMVDEVIRGRILETWVTPLANSRDPIGTLQEILHGFGSLTEEEVIHGCPLNNLSQEMSGVDEEFRTKLADLYTLWRDGLRDALARGQSAGTVRREIDPEKVALFFISSVEGAFGMAKSQRGVGVLNDAAEVLSSFLDTIRAHG